MKKIKFCMSILLSGIIFSADTYSGNFPEYWLGRMSKYSSKIFCEDTVFLKKTGFSKNQCITNISNYSIRCNKIIKPLLSDDIDEKDLANTDFSRGLGELYSLCLWGAAFQQESSKNQESKQESKG